MSAKRVLNRPLSQYQQQMVADLNNGLFEHILQQHNVRARSSAREPVWFHPDGIAILIPHVTNVDSLNVLLANDEITQDIFNALLENALEKKNNILLKVMFADVKMAAADKKMLNDEFRKRPYELVYLLL